MDKLNRDNTPPKRKDILWVERVKGGQRQKFSVYSANLWGVWTHWCGNHTAPCYEDHSRCEGGHEEETMRWRGYVHGYSFERSRPEFLQLTPGACHEWLQQLAEGMTLRGQIIEVWRTKHDKGRLHVAVNQWQQTKSAQLPPELDPMKSLFALWKVPLVTGVNRSLVTAPADVPAEGEIAA